MFLLCFLILSLPCIRSEIQSRCVLLQHITTQEKVTLTPKARMFHQVKVGITQVGSKCQPVEPHPEGSGCLRLQLPSYRLGWGSPDRRTSPDCQDDQGCSIKEHKSTQKEKTICFICSLPGSPWKKCPVLGFSLTFRRLKLLFRFWTRF